MFRLSFKGERLQLNMLSIEAMKIIGAVKNKHGISFPKDPVVINYLKGLVNQNIEISEDVLDWYTSLQKHYDKVKDIIENSRKMELGNYLDTILKDYQKIGIKFLLEAKRCILGDDMGLGKSLQLLSALHYVHSKRTIIIAPAYVKYTWKAEIEKWLSGYTVFLADGTKKVRENIITDFRRCETPAILIVNYEMLQYRNIEKIMDNGIKKKVMEFKFPEIQMEADVLILDECHRAKNRKNLSIPAIKNIKSKYLWCATGTPINKDPAEIWQILNLIDPSIFTSYWNFAQFYCNVQKNFYGGMDVVSIRREKAYNSVINRYMFRRIKEDVLPELPEKIVHEIPIELNKKHMQCYKYLFKYLDGAGNIIESDLELFIRLSQCVQAPKLVYFDEESTIYTAIKELYTDITANNNIKPVIIAFDSKISAELFHQEKILKDTEIITGAVKMEKRHEILNRFKSGKFKVLITTQKALAEGVSIDECNDIIFADVSYSNVVNAQFRDRIRRMTTTEVKNYFFLIANNTCQSFKYYKMKEEQENNKNLLKDSDSNMIVKISDEYLLKLRLKGELK